MFGRMIHSKEAPRVSQCPCKDPSAFTKRVTSYGAAERCQMAFAGIQYRLDVCGTPELYGFVGLSSFDTTGWTGEFLYLTGAFKGPLLTCRSRRFSIATTTAVRIFLLLLAHSMAVLVPHFLLCYAQCGQSTSNAGQFLQLLLFVIPFTNSCSQVSAAPHEILRSCPGKTE